MGDHDLEKGWAELFIEGGFWGVILSVALLSSDRTHRDFISFFGEGTKSLLRLVNSRQILF
jgi:hypothetical protein